MWNLKIRNVFASPSLSYLLSSHLVGLCAALDGGTTYGMPAGPGAAVAPLFDTDGQRLRSLAHVGLDLALTALHMWTTWMAKAQETLRKARSNVADAYSTCGGRGDGSAVPPARQARMPSLQQALRACLQQCEQRLAALRNAVQGAGEAAGGSGAQHAPSPRPPSGFPQPAGPATRQSEIAAAPAPVEGEEEPAASPQDRSSAHKDCTISSPEASQQRSCDTLAERIRRCEKDARRIRELLSGAPLPPLNAAAAFDISMRLAVSCASVVQRAAAAVAPAAGASDGVMCSAAADPSVRALDAGQQQQGAGPLLRAADALTLASKALACAHAVCAEVSELPYSQVRASPRALQRLRRMWTTQLTLGTAADSAGLLADIWHVACFVEHARTYPHMRRSGPPPLEPFAEAVVAVEAGFLPFAERALRRAADPQDCVRRLLIGSSYGNWAQALSLCAPRQSASLLLSLAKALRQAAAKVLQAALAAKAEQAREAAGGGREDVAAAKRLCYGSQRTLRGVSGLLCAVLALFGALAGRACAKPGESQAECSAGASDAVSGDGRAPGVVGGGGALGSQPSRCAIEQHADDNACNSSKIGSSGDAAGGYGAGGAVTGPALAMSLAATHLMPAMCLLLRRLVACNLSYLKPDIVASLLSAVPVLAAAATPCAAPPFALQGEAGPAAVGSPCAPALSGPGQPSREGDAGSGSSGGNDRPVGQRCVDQCGGAASQSSSCQVSIDADTATSPVAAGAGGSGGEGGSPSGSVGLTQAGAVAAWNEWRCFLVRDLDLPWLLRVGIDMASGGREKEHGGDVPGLRACLAPALRAALRCMPDELAATLVGRGRTAVAKAATAGGQRPPKGPPSLSQLRALLGPGGAMADPELLAAVEAACGDGGGAVLHSDEGDRADAAAAALLVPPSAVLAALPVCSNPLCTNLEGDSEAALRLRGCAGCGEAARYCSRSCQVAHWRAGHSKECAGRGAAAAAAAAATGTKATSSTT